MSSTFFGSLTLTKNKTIGIDNVDFPLSRKKKKKNLIGNGMVLIKYEIFVVKKLLNHFSTEINISNVSDVGGFHFCRRS